MCIVTLDLHDGRSVMLGLIDALPHLSRREQFVVLVPAFNSAEREKVVAVTSNLVDLGCKEFCCVGPEAEPLHDAIDAIVEDSGALEIVTTWYTDGNDACEYFLFAAGAAKLTLLALVSEHPKLISMLESRSKTT